MEACRQQNQDPIPRRAEELFAFLTLDRFTGLRSDLDGKSDNVVWVVRHNGHEEKVSALSEAPPTSCTSRCDRLPWTVMRRRVGPCRSWWMTCSQSSLKSAARPR